ncbi:uncharacterized protein UTRI_01386_B [Ustilago trichophora]|uniref:Uncharacterized protein n=1 Tax=Ustilago trichophora TaxID=86804 RepID=A0A5C3E5V8_9BASI|nr:uncharacterized protein UTRI_01386_B [Ustilago trichophora]
MSERDEVASVSASQKSSHTPSVKDDIVKDGLTPEHLESLYTDLPSDATALKAIVGTMRLELSKKDQSITKLKEEMDEVKASHSVVLQRSAEWQDELETLRLRVPQLEDELRSEKQAREAESDRVKDLRIRAEESRRAIMRLQGEQSDARAKAKVDNRRSWIPAATNPPPVRDEQEEAELKKSKRASLAFGPNALNLNLAARPSTSQGYGHRRTASGGRSVSGASGASKADIEESEEPLSPTFANGLRGLRLSGTAGTNGTGSSLLIPGSAAGDDNGSAPNSRRSSFRSDAGKSPRLGLNDLPVPDSADITSSLGARLSVPPTGPGGQRSLLSSPALSQGAASSAGVGSPIIEDNEDEDHKSSLVAKALPNLPSRESSMHFQAHDRELRAKEVEIERLTREMTEMRLSMEEALEARKASEACLKALRDFIAHHDAEADASGQMGDDADRIVQRASFGAGLLKGVKLPPLPTDDIDEDEEKAHVSPQKTSGSGGGGWSMKLPTLMRKATSSNGPTPSDEAKPTVVSEAETGNGSATASPRNSAGASATAPASAAPAKSIASGFAGLGNLLGGRTGTTPNEPAAAPALVTSPQPESASSPQPDETGSGFKSFGGWFKRSSVLTNSPSAEQQQPTSTITVEETVLSPPFRSLDHDQLSISRQSVISPLSETQAKQLANGSNMPSSASRDSFRSTSGSNSNMGSNNALAMAARLGDEEEAKKVAESMRQPELGHRAQRAAEKTESVELLTDVLPSFD